jgi:hypothetical protein
MGASRGGKRCICPTPRIFGKKSELETGRKYRKY